MDAFAYRCRMSTIEDPIKIAQVGRVMQVKSEYHALTAKSKGIDQGRSRLRGIDGTIQLADEPVFIFVE